MWVLHSISCGKKLHLPVSRIAISFETLLIELVTWNNKRIPSALSPASSSVSLSPSMNAVASTAFIMALVPHFSFAFRRLLQQPLYLMSPDEKIHIPLDTHYVEVHFTNCSPLIALWILLQGSFLGGVSAFRWLSEPLSALSPLLASRSILCLEFILHHLCTFISSSLLPYLRTLHLPWFSFFSPSPSLSWPPLPLHLVRNHTQTTSSLSSSSWITPFFRTCIRPLLSIVQIKMRR